jgi:hypothetical protein
MGLEKPYTCYLAQIPIPSGVAKYKHHHRMIEQIMSSMRTLGGFDAIMWVWQLCERIDFKCETSLCVFDHASLHQEWDQNQVGVECR